MSGTIIIALSDKALFPVVRLTVRKCTTVQYGFRLTPFNFANSLVSLQNTYNKQVDLIDVSVSYKTPN